MVKFKTHGGRTDVGEVKEVDLPGRVVRGSLHQGIPGGQDGISQDETWQYYSEAANMQLKIVVTVAKRSKDMLAISNDMTPEEKAKYQ